MLIGTHRQESLSRAYIQAIASRCGLNCSFRDFDYGIDVTVHLMHRRNHRYVESGFNLTKGEPLLRRSLAGNHGTVEKWRGSAMSSPNGTLSLERVVRVTDLRAYLLSKGWRIKPFKRLQVIYFEGFLDDDGRPLVLLVPASEQLRDYPLRIEEILNTLSIVERRPAAEIVRNIVTPTSDILHLRLESPDTRTGTLELRFVERFYSSMKDLLVFAACGQFEPRPFYPRALKQAVLFADKCRYRPAAAGSFRVDVEAPLTPPANEAQIQLRDYPIERLVLTSLFQGLGELQKAVDSGQTATFLAQQHRRINANLCDAIVGMKPDTADVIWEISVSWSPAWPVDDLSIPQSVRFEDRSFEQITAIGRALRGGNKPRQGLLRGRVIRLSGRDPVHGESGPLTVLLAVDTPDAPAHVEIVLSPKQYRQLRVVKIIA